MVLPPAAAGSRLWAAPWCSGLTCHPVTVEIEGSNPFGVANSQPIAAGQIGQRLFYASRLQHVTKQGPEPRFEDSTNLKFPSVFGP